MTDQERAARTYRHRDALRVAGAGGGIGSAAIGAYLLTQVSGLTGLIQDQGHTIAALVERVSAMQVQTDTLRSDLGGARREIDARVKDCDSRAQLLGREQDEQARELREHDGRLRALEAQRAAVQGMRAPDTQGRIAQLVAAIRQLSPADRSAWIGTPPKPTARALSALTGTPVSAGERDAAAAVWMTDQETDPASAVPLAISK